MARNNSRIAQPVVPLLQDPNAKASDYYNYFDQKAAPKAPAKAASGSSSSAPSKSASGSSSSAPARAPVFGPAPKPATPPAAQSSSAPAKQPVSGQNSAYKPPSVSYELPKPAPLPAKVPDRDLKKVLGIVSPELVSGADTQEIVQDLLIQRQRLIEQQNFVDVVSPMADQLPGTSLKDAYSGNAQKSRIRRGPVRQAAREFAAEAVDSVGAIFRATGRDQATNIMPETKIRNIDRFLEKYAPEDLALSRNLESAQGTNRIARTVGAGAEMLTEAVATGSVTLKAVRSVPFIQKLHKSGRAGVVFANIIENAAIDIAANVELGLSKGQDREQIAKNVMASPSMLLPYTNFGLGGWKGRLVGGAMVTAAPVLDYLAGRYVGMNEREAMINAMAGFGAGIVDYTSIKSEIRDLDAFMDMQKQARSLDEPVAKILKQHADDITARVRQDPKIINDIPGMYDDALGAAKENRLLPFRGAKGTPGIDIPTAPPKGALKRSIELADGTVMDVPDGYLYRSISSDQVDDIVKQQRLLPHNSEGSIYYGTDLKAAEHYAVEGHDAMIRVRADEAGRMMTDKGVMRSVKTFDEVPASAVEVRGADGAFRPLVESPAIDGASMRRPVFGESRMPGLEGDAKLTPQQKLDLLRQAKQVENPDILPFDAEADALLKEAKQKGMELRKQAIPELFEAKLPAKIFDDAKRTDGIQPFTRDALQAMGTFGTKVKKMQDQLLQLEKDISSTIGLGDRFFLLHGRKNKLARQVTKSEANRIANQTSNLQLAREIAGGDSEAAKDVQTLLDNYDVLKSLHEDIATTAKVAQEAGSTIQSSTAGRTAKRIATRKQAPKTKPVQKKPQPSVEPKLLEEAQPKRDSRLRTRLETPTRDLTIDEPTRSNIKQFIADQFQVPIRTGRVSPGAGAIFKPGSNTVRMRNERYLDIGDVSHEVGHYLDQELGLRAALKQDTGRYIPQYRMELKKLAEDPAGFSSAKAKSASTERKMEEGIAEFIRKYVVDPQALNKEAPNFYKFFEERVPEEGRRVLQTARDAFKQYGDAGAEFRVKSQISVNEKEKTGDISTKLFEALDDDLVRIKQFTKQAESKLKTTLDYGDDPYVLARLTRGLDAKAQVYILPGMQPRNWDFSKADARSLGDTLNAVGSKRVDDFRAYLISKRALDLNKRGIQSGITTADAEDVIKTMESRHGDFAGLQKDIVKWNQSLLQYARDGGLISDDQLKGLIEKGANYVPFYRVMDEGAKTAGKGGSGFGKNAAPIKAIKGSDRQIVDPLESMVRNAYMIISATDRNNVAQAMVKLAARHPDLGMSIEAVPASMKGIQISKENLAKQIGVDPDELDGLENIVTLFVKGQAKSGEPIMPVMVDGKPQEYYVQPDLLNAINNMNRENLSIVMRMLQVPASTLRAGATLTPEFIGRNPFRDQATAFLYSRGNYIPFWDFGKGLGNFIKNSDDAQTVQFGGALQSAFVSMDRRSLNKSVQDVMKTNGGKAVDYFLHPLDALRALSEFGEMGTRIGEGSKVYNRLKKRGLSDREAALQAAFSARNVTLDFARMGYAGRTMNSITAFWNANIQDMTKFARELTGREKGANPMNAFTKGVIGLTVPTIGFYEMSKNDPRYEDLPRWQKDYFWIISVGEDKPLIRLPKPFLPGLIFGSLPQRMLESQEKKDLQPMRDFFTSLREISVPGIFPTALMPLIEYTTNYSFFFSRSIVPQSEQSLLPEDQYGIFTNEIYKEIGDLTNTSPRKIETLVYGYTAGLGRYASNFIDWAGGKAGVLDEKPVLPADPTNKPVIRGFTISDLAGSSRAVEDFYTVYNEADQAYNSLMQAYKQGNKERAQEILNDYGDRLVFEMPNGNKEFVNYAMGAASEAMGMLRDARDEVMKSKTLDPEAKASKIKQINAQLRQIAQRSLRAVNQFRKQNDE